MTHVARLEARRRFLRFLAASPYVSACGGLSVLLEEGMFAQNGASVAAGAGEVIAGPAEASNVLDFEEAAGAVGTDILHFPRELPLCQPAACTVFEELSGVRERPMI